jgi:hypothetical protein
MIPRRRLCTEPEYDCLNAVCLFLHDSWDHVAQSLPCFSLTSRGWLLNMKDTGSDSWTTELDALNDRAASLRTQGMLIDDRTVHRLRAYT